MYLCCHELKSSRCIPLRSQGNPGSRTREHLYAPRRIQDGSASSTFRGSNVYLQKSSRCNLYAPKRIHDESAYPYAPRFQCIPPEVHSSMLPGVFSSGWRSSRCIILRFQDPVHTFRRARGVYLYAPMDGRARGAYLYADTRIEDR